MTDLLSICVNIAYIGLFTSFVFALIRLIKGPTHADRVLALDLIGFITISFITAHTIRSGQTAFLDIAITLALVAFLGTVAFVTFMKKRLVDPDDKKKGGPWNS
ncbi:monovalent cation/H+ antiporter complex subunit F [Desulfospira joergensenii]|uniref:monovalent cation/H+ antiporter complex subunit F n=1 Tax=Desulfospira joergensenii TaxID=53329 RepID=UPI0003B7A149|nr:cation:proton antiporter [Desulfospira joergensenii]